MDAKRYITNKKSQIKALKEERDSLIHSSANLGINKELEIKNEYTKGKRNGRN